ncbi:MAG: acetyl-CoA acetyltransferase [Pseudomonadota bacterium]
MDSSKLAVLVGASQITNHAEHNRDLTPIDLMVKASRSALADTGVAHLEKHITHITACGLTVEAEQAKTPFKGAFNNVPLSVGKRLGVTDADFLFARPGGNTPQYLINHFVREIAEGKEIVALLTGGEALQSLFQRFSPWYKLLLPWGHWREKHTQLPTLIGEDRREMSDVENRHGINLPSNVYPLFENALRAHYGHGVDTHLQKVGALFAKFSHVASENPYAWFQQSRSAEELITPTSSNRMIAYPYTKRLNSMIMVNQAASLVLTTESKALALGVPKDRLIYVHGCADQNDHWYMSERENYYSSPALRSAAKRSLAQAKRSIDDIALLDLYSCFPSAVQIACDELGIAHDDARPFTLTGGLPYFGGPGNNYAMHGLAEMVSKLREHPNEYGLLNANGWYLTKHSVGVYSSIRPQENIDIGQTEQQTLSRELIPTFAIEPKGAVTIETFTVIYNKQNKPKKAIIIARDEADNRVLANSLDPEVLENLLTEDVVGLRGQIRRRSGKNHFYF